jgi:hypothetical protein
VVSDPSDNTLQSASQGVANADSAMGVRELGDGGADVRHILQHCVSKVVNASETFSNHCIALARVPTNQCKAGTEFNLGRIHLSSVNKFRLDMMQSQSIVLTVSFLSFFSGLFQQ